MTDKQLRRAIEAQIEKYKDNRFVKILVTALGVCAIVLIIAYLFQEDMLPEGKTETEIKTTFDNTPMLYTLQCEAQTIVTQHGEQSLSWLGDRDFIIPVRGNIKVGYDLKKIKKFQIDGNVLKVTLPDPVIELQTAEPLYNQAVSKVGFFRSEFSQKEKADIIKEGVNLLKKKIQEYDLIPPAQDQARMLLESMIRQMGYEPEISFPTYSERNVKKMIKLGSDLTKVSSSK